MNASRIQHYSSYKNRGFVILFAMIVAAMITLIGAGIFSVAFKETVLSSTVSESQVALFAADTGLECTLYHEFVEPDTDTDIQCATATVTTGGSTANYSFRFNFAALPNCGYVTVDRAVTRTTGTTSVVGTEIVSRGYNVCINDQPDTSSQFLVERRLEVWYPNVIAPPPPPPPGGGGTGTSTGPDTTNVSAN